MSNSRFGLRTRTGLVRGIVEGNIAPLGLLFLDSYPGATFAYSLRKLSSSYTGNCIRVRRSSDNTEQNIGFFGDVLDTASLLSFVGANNGFVTIWYDQSGNGHNLTQLSSTSQPQIVNAGSVLTLNTKPYIFSDGINDSMSTTNTFSYNDATMIIVAAQFGIGDTSFGRFIDNDFTNGFWFGRNLSANEINGGFLQPNPPYGNIFPYTNDLQFLLYSIRVGGTTTSYLNNGAPSSITTSAALSSGGIVAIGSSNVASFFGRKYHQEYIFYTSNQVSNRGGMQSQINSFYNTYV